MSQFGAVLRGAAGSFVRVWAPNATGLGVIGDFCGWNAAAAVQLTSAGGGFWEGLVAGLAADGRVYVNVSQWPVTMFRLL